MKFQKTQSEEGGAEKEASWRDRKEMTSGEKKLVIGRVHSPGKGEKGWEGEKTVEGKGGWGAATPFSWGTLRK